MQADISRSDWFQQARTLSTPEISDALDFFNLPGSALGIRPVAGPAKLFGLAFTIRFAPIDRFAVQIDLQPWGESEHGSLDNQVSNFGSSCSASPWAT